MSIEQYLKLSTMEYPFSKKIIDELLIDVHVQEERQQIISDYVFVKETSKPIVGEYQTAILDTPRKSNDEWFQVWKVESVFKDFTDEDGTLHTAEDQEIAIRAEREAQRLNGIENLIVREIQKRLDAFVKLKRYDNIDKVYMRATLFGSPFQEECFHAAIRMEEYWKAYIDILTQVKMGLRKHPEAFSEIESELPVLEWSKTL